MAQDDFAMFLEQLTANSAAPQQSQPQMPQSQSLAQRPQPQGLVNNPAMSMAMPAPPRQPNATQPNPAQQQQQPSSQLSSNNPQITSQNLQSILASLPQGLEQAQQHRHATQSQADLARQLSTHAAAVAPPPTSANFPQQQAQPDWRSLSAVNNQSANSSSSMRPPQGLPAGLTSASPQIGLPTSSNPGQAFPPAGQQHQGGINNAPFPGLNMHVTNPLPTAQMQQQMSSLSGTSNAPSQTEIINYVRLVGQINTLKARVSTLQKCLAENQTTAGPVPRSLSAPEREQYNRIILADEQQITQLNQHMSAFQAKHGGEQHVTAIVSAALAKLNPNNPQATMLGQQARNTLQQQQQQQSGQMGPQTSMQPAPGGRPTSVPPRQQTPLNQPQTQPQSLQGTPQQPSTVPSQQQQQQTQASAIQNQANPLASLSQFQLTQMQSQLPQEQDFNNMLQQLHVKNNSYLPPAHFVEGTAVNLFMLFRHALRFGGMQGVNARTQSNQGSNANQGTWAHIAHSLGLFAGRTQIDGSTMQRIASLTQQLYVAHLASFEYYWATATIKRLTGGQQQQSQPQQQPSVSHTPVPQQQQQNGQQQTSLSQAQINNQQQHLMQQYAAQALPADPAFLAKIGFNQSQIDAYIKSKQQQQHQQQQQQPDAQQQQQGQQQQQFRAIAPQPQPQGQQPAQGPSQQRKPGMIPGYEQEVQFVTREYDKQSNKRVPQTPITNISDAERHAVGQALDSLWPSVIRTREVTPIFFRACKNQTEPVCKTIAICLLLAEARQTFKTRGQATLTLETVTKLKAHLDWCMTQVQQHVRANPIGSQNNPPAAQAQPQTQAQQSTPAPPQQQASVEGFSREALMAGMKPGLRVEDLKPPPVRPKKVQQGGSPAMHHESPAKTLGALASGSSPATMAGPSPAAAANNNKPTKQGSTVGTPASSAANKKGHARTNSNKFPTQDDIMAAVKRERGGSTKQEGATPMASAASPARPASVDAAKQRQKEVEDAKTDPLPFLKQAWSELTSTSAGDTPKAKTAGAAQSLAYLPDDLVGHLDLAAEPVIPQPVRDPSELSFVTPQPTFAELGASGAAATNGTTAPTTNGAAGTADFDFDWTIYLNDDGDKHDDTTGTTPELDESRPDELTPSSSKDEAKTPENAQLGKAQLLAKLQQRSPQVAEAELSPSGSSVSSAKRKLSEMAVNDEPTPDDSSDKRKKPSPPPPAPSHSQSTEAFDLSDPDSFDQIAWPRADFFKSSSTVY